MRPPSPADIRDAARREQTLIGCDSRRATCVGAGLPEPWLGTTAEFDANSPILYKGLLATSATNTKAIGMSYYRYGGVASVSATDGTTATASASAGTNYAAPESISVQNYSQTVSYNAWLGITSQTGANGEQLSMTYDNYGRPYSGTSPYGAVTSYTYGTAAPYTQTESGPNGVTITTLDGFGRAVLVQRGDSTSPDSTTSYTATVYAPCVCSPLGKVQQVSMPYPSGGTPVYTVYAYDGLGRTVSVRKPDGASTTYYVYAGNQTKVTDPATNWKQFTKDVLGNLTTVVEPDPANQPGGTLTTSYTYDWMNHVSCVDMDRGGTLTAATTYVSNGVTCTTVYASGTGTRQTRTFVYDTGGRLTSATNPENGTVTYTYNSTNTLNTKVDAKGQAAVYTYDSLNRVLEIQRYPNGVSGAEDVCSRVTYTYDTNPVNSSFSQYSQGRLTTAQYYVRNAGTWDQCSLGYDYYDSYTEMYSYQPAGAVTAKNVQFQRWIYSTWLNQRIEGTGSLEVDYTQDTAGRTSTVTYPMTFENNQSAQPVLTMAYDAMGRPSSLTDLNGDVTYAPTQWVYGVQYDYAGRLAAIGYLSGQIANGVSYVNETRTYNVNGQLASIGWPSSSGAQYVYSTTGNNGQITQEIDSWLGAETTINYQYDALKRVISATATPTGSSQPPYNDTYTQQFQYDGFGNLTAKVLNETTTTIAVNAATNQLANAYYDLNGNMTSGAGASFTYDEANRNNSVTETSGGQEFYGYDAANKRVYVRDTNGAEWFTFYGAKGEKLGKYGISFTAADTNPGYPGCENVNYVMVCPLTITPTATSVWFAGRLILDLNNGVQPDRLGTNRWNYSWFLPYGDGPAGNDRVRFATYTRDSYTGLDYANQRMYASTYGRFLTPDPMGAKAANPNDPESWNRYAYAIDDPVNRNDPNGLCPPGYVPATTAQDQSIVNTAESYVGQGLQHSNGDHFTTNASGSLTAIDCTGLLMQALAGIAYTSGVFQAASNPNIVSSQIPNLFSATSSYQIGNIVYIPGHAVIVASVNAQGQITSFVGSQSSTGPAIVSTSSSSWAYWGPKIAAAEAAGQVYTPCVPAGTQASLPSGAEIAAAEQYQQFASMWQAVIDSPGMASSFLDWVDSIPVGDDSYEVDEAITYE
jgi:RHS repeat-associated protein